MKYFPSCIKQHNKDNQAVCGDYIMCHRTSEHTLVSLCDGIGSGVYANISAITCAERLMSLCISGLNSRSACKQVAASMHEARQRDIPFAAFSMVRILDDGFFYIYTYESPAPLLIRDGRAQVLPQAFHNASYEVLAEATGKLEFGDMLVVFSDGVSQAGMGEGYGFGLGSEGVVKFINEKLETMGNRVRLTANKLAEGIDNLAFEMCGNRYADDTSIVVIGCREAREIVVATGPPQRKNSDCSFAEDFIHSAGRKVICGSTTTDVISRELGRPVELLSMGRGGIPPEYRMDGVDMVTEGAIMLSQVYNIFGEDVDRLTDDTPVERLCRYLQTSDHVTFMLGEALNEAHTDLIFKQVGVRTRRNAVKLLAERLREMGKVVDIFNY